MMLRNVLFHKFVNLCILFQRRQSLSVNKCCVAGLPSSSLGKQATQSPGQCFLWKTAAEVFAMSFFSFSQTYFFQKLSKEQ